MFEFVRVWRAFWRFKVATVSGSGNAFQTAFDPIDVGTLDKAYQGGWGFQ
jgi:hypothetical protein